jgi:ADP-ribose pyrophosphatase YjhB (NUDIX family)
MQRAESREIIEALTFQFPTATIVEDVRHLSAENFAAQKTKQEEDRSQSGVIGVVWTKSDELVLVERTGLHAGWALIGGTVKPDEGFLEAFERETLEEAGVKLDKLTINLLSIEDRRFVSSSGEELFFVLGVCQGIIAAGQKIRRTRHAIEEKLEVHTFSTEALPETMIFDDDQAKLEAAMVSRGFSS